MHFNCEVRRQGKKRWKEYKKSNRCPAGQGVSINVKALSPSHTAGSLCSQLSVMAEAPGFLFFLNALTLGNDTPSHQPPRAQPPPHPAPKTLLSKSLMPIGCTHVYPFG